MYDELTPEQAAREAMRPKTEAEEAAIRAARAIADAKYEKQARQWRREARWRYLRSKEFRGDLFSTVAFFVVLAGGLDSLSDDGGGNVALVYSLVAAAAVSYGIKKVYSR